MIESNSDIARLMQCLRKFAEERDWNQFHSPKNLSMALAAEAAELLEHFQWLTEEQSANLSDEKRNEVALELADIFNYLLRLADKLDVDLVATSHEKILLNEQKYPADEVRGKAVKYHEIKAQARSRE